MIPLPMATITGGSPRAETWRRVFGGLEVPIMLPLVFHAELPGLGMRAVYLCEIRRLTADQRGRVVAHLAATFDVPVAEVEASLDEEGLPLLAEDLSVTFDARSVL